MKPEREFADVGTELSSTGALALLGFGLVFGQTAAGALSVAFGLWYAYAAGVANGFWKAFV